MYRYYKWFYKNLVTEADIVFGLVRRMIDAGLKSS